jgi:hypothetical protein
VLRKGLFRERGCPHPHADGDGAVEKVMFVAYTRMGVTGRRVFEHARVCVCLFKPITGKGIGLEAKPYQVCPWHPPNGDVDSYNGFFNSPGDFRTPRLKRKKLLAVFTNPPSHRHFEVGCRRIGPRNRPGNCYRG